MIKIVNTNDNQREERIKKYESQIKDNESKDIHDKVFKEVQETILSEMSFGRIFIDGSEDYEDNIFIDRYKELKKGKSTDDLIYLNLYVMILRDYFMIQIVDNSTPYTLN